MDFYIIIICFMTHEWLFFFSKTFIVYATYYDCNYYELYKYILIILHYARHEGGINYRPRAAKTINTSLVACDMSVHARVQCYTRYTSYEYNNNNIITRVYTTSVFSRRDVRINITGDRSRGRF